jgi:hypothetical protein
MQGHYLAFSANVEKSHPHLTQRRDQSSQQYQHRHQGRPSSSMCHQQIRSGSTQVKQQPDSNEQNAAHLLGFFSAFSPPGHPPNIFVLS